jgi:polyphenol oxidase
MKLYNFFYKEVSPGVQQLMGFFPDAFVGLQTTRVGGVSAAPFDSFNLATHVGDKPQVVERNRARLAALLPNPPVWLEQVHGCDSVVIAGGLPRDDDKRHSLGVTRADASITAEPNQPCAVMTADCLPLLVARPATGQCAAIHAGWKGLAAGVIEKTLEKLKVSETNAVSDTAPVTHTPDTWYIWLGPVIGQGAFEVGPEVREKFVQHNAKAGAAFLPSPKRKGHFLASLEQLALLRLQTFESINSQAELHIAVDRDCVFSCPERYFSFRRNSETGRMASLIFRRMGQEP